jgi:hypothetical protein
MKKRGRPPSPDGPSVKVDIRLSAPLYDAMCRVALRHNEPVTRIIRHALQRYFLPVDKSAAV